MPTKTTKPKKPNKDLPVTQEIEPCEIEKVLTNPTQIDDKNGIISEDIGNKLTLRQQRFCELYATDREFFGHGVNCYVEVYAIDTTQKGWYNTAGVCASKLLRNAKICARINELLSKEGFNEQFADQQLLYLMTQHEDKKAKVAAIKEFNNLKNRITKKLELSGSVSLLRDLSTDELIKKLEDDSKKE